MPKASENPKKRVEGHHQAAPKKNQEPPRPAQSANRSETGKVHPPYRQSRHSKPGIPALPDQIPTPQLIANPHRSKWRGQNSTSCDSVLERFSDAEKQPAQIKNQTWRPRNLHPSGPCALCWSHLPQYQQCAVCVQSIPSLDFTP